MKVKPAAGTGALVLGAALLGPAATRVAPPVVVASPDTTIGLQTLAKESEKAKALNGPWQASCKYWGLPGKDAACGPDQWGNLPPAEADPAQRHVTALLATLPDPVHSSMSMEFDRMIDVITQAAEDNGYLVSHYWLPWQRPVEKKKAKEKSKDTDEDHDEEAEHEPGLLLLKPAAAGCDLPRGMATDEDGNPCSPVVYLFLVGQTPALGMNRDQLSRALTYENDLVKRGQANLSIRHPTSEADVIGPNNSGSASSLRDELLHAPFSKALKTISIAGSTSTGLATSVLNAKSDPKLHYVSFSEDVVYERCTVERLFTPPVADAAAGSSKPNGEPSYGKVPLFFSPHDSARLVFLTETGTTFGVETKTSKESNELAVTAVAQKAKRRKPVTRGLSSQTTQPEAALNPCGTQAAKPDNNGSSELVIHFPREISILRNAQKQQASGPQDAAAAALADADPYLHLSLKNGDTEDTIPHFSREIFPYIEESEWMAVIRELQDRHAQTVAVSATNVLDSLFLAQTIHRDLPDMQPLFYASSDLLFVRAGDAEPYVGAISVTAYPLTALTPANSYGRLNNFASFSTQSYYNAVSYTLWTPKGDAIQHTPEGDKQVEAPKLAGYSRVDPKTGLMLPPPLWITTVGRDGYYPLSLASPCSSTNNNILPTFKVSGTEASPAPCASDSSQAEALVIAALRERREYPSIAWFLLDALVIVLCLTHIITFWVADFWSPVTHDLDIAHADEPRRRAVYLHICTAMLWSMSAVVSFPIFFAADRFWFPQSIELLAALTLLCGVGAVVATLWKTLPHIGRPLPEDRVPRAHCKRTALAEIASTTRKERLNLRHPGKYLRHLLAAQQAKLEQLRFFIAEINLYPTFNLMALVTAVVVPTVWALLCSDGSPFAPGHQLLGTFFSYRCLHPVSGVSPMLPLLLVMLSWCLWAFFQARRLRFSENSRPILPGPLSLTPDIYTSFYVDDTALSNCSTRRGACLYDNVSCLLITHRILWRATTGSLHLFNALFIGGYFVLFAGFTFFLPIRALDHYLRPLLFHLTPFEALIAALFYPLLVIALSGALRMVMIWSSLRSGLLERLERSPLRYAFSRLTHLSWMTMLRQSGMMEYWRDMTRSNESMAQILSSRDFFAVIRDNAFWKTQAVDARTQLEQHIKDLYVLFAGKSLPGQTPPAWDKPGNYLVGPDIPGLEHRAFLNYMCAIECEYARFSEALLQSVLLPYWTSRRAELVEAEAPGEEALSHTVTAAPAPIQLAEEFLAMRYLSLIRAILINLRQLMTFVSISFVLALLAWNSYPFQPRRWVDWAFTGLLLGLGAAIVWVFAQMHRNPILSRITGTEANKLGIDFFIRLAVFGAAPVLTWMASQFPAVGATISRLLQSGMAVAK